MSDSDKCKIGKIRRGICLCEDGECAYILFMYKHMHYLYYRLTYHSFIIKADWKV